MQTNFVQACRERGLVLDANIAVLLFVGITDPKDISQHKRLAKYSEQDFLLLKNVVKKARKLILPAYTIPEFSNLVPLDAKDGVTTKYFRRAIRFLNAEKIKENYVPFKTLLDHPKLPSFGFTDMSFTNLPSEYAILTDDKRLYGFLLQNNYIAMTMEELKRRVPMKNPTPARGWD